MSKHEMEYGDRFLSVELDKGVVLGSIGAKEVEKIANLPAKIIELLRKPISSPPLDKIVRAKDTVVILAPDITRLWSGPEQFLPPLVDELNKIGVTDNQITILLGTGDHRTHTPQEVERLVTRDLMDRIEVFDHLAREKKELTYLGETSRSNKVWINRRVMESDKVILTGGIVYHFLTGFGGGPKALSIGVAGYDTIQVNHRLALGTPEQGINPKVQSGYVDGNPLRDDVIEIMKMAKAHFLLDTVINPQKEIAGVVAGDPLIAHLEGCRLAEDFFSIPTHLKGDMIVASAMGYPEDINLYQVYKAFDNISRVTKPGGVIVLFAECRDGMGNDDFSHILRAFSSNTDRYNFLKENCTIGGLMGFGIALWAERFKVVLYSSISPKELENSGIQPVSSPQEAIAMGYDLAPDNPDIVLMPHSSVTFPVVEAD
ncbi:MAG: nickel-dependent lactate racemase [Thermodesulfobacteriota bacterium]